MRYQYIWNKNDLRKRYPAAFQISEKKWIQKMQNNTVYSPQK